MIQKGTEKLREEVTKMNKRLRERILSEIEFTTERLQTMDMGAKGSAIQAAMYQARVEALKQVLDWGKEEDDKTPV